MAEIEASSAKTERKTEIEREKDVNIVLCKSSKEYLWPTLTNLFWIHSQPQNFENKALLLLLFVVNALIFSSPCRGWDAAMFYS